MRLWPKRRQQKYARHFWERFLPWHRCHLLLPVIYFNQLGNMKGRPEWSEQPVFKRTPWGKVTHQRWWGGELVEPNTLMALWDDPMTWISHCCLGLLWGSRMMSFWWYIYLLDKYLISTYYVLGTILSPGGRAEQKRQKYLPSRSLLLGSRV